MLLFELFESTLDPETAASTPAPDPYDEIAAQALPQYRFTYGKPEHIEALRQRHTELYRKMRRSYLQGTMADGERREMYHLEDALKRYREAKPLHRIGRDHEFSEFTHDPSGKGYPAKMNGGRDTGFASGMYAFQTPREGTVEVSPPRNPLVIDDLPEHEARHASIPGVFQSFAVSLMRMAKEYADYKPEPVAPWEVEFARNYDKPGIDFDRGLRIKPDLWRMKGYGGMEFKRIVKFFEHYHEPAWRVADDLASAITSWEKHRQVHPLNILLSRWGHDGVIWGDSDKAQEGNSGTYGAVKFPPIDAEGRLIGLDPVNSKYMRMRGRD